MIYLSCPEVAELLRISLRTLTSFTAAVLVPSPYQLGRRVLWDETTLYEFMQRPLLVSIEAEPVNRSRGWPLVL